MESLTRNVRQLFIPLAVILLLVVSFSHDTQSAYAANAIRAGFNSGGVVPASDDGSSGAVPIGFTINFFGVTFNSLFVNNNGNVTFDAPLSAFNPFSLSNTGRQIIAPFFADVDTRGTASKIVSYGPGTAYGLPAFGVNWIDVGYFQQKSDKLNSFQLVIIDRSDINPGDFDFEFNYNKIQWEYGDVQAANTPPGPSARAGYSNGSGLTGTAFELPGSAVGGAFLDSSGTGLANTSYRSSVLGRHIFSIRNGSNAVVPLNLVEPAVPTPDRDCYWTSDNAGDAFTVAVPDNAVPDGAVRCHVLNRDGIYVENPGQIGVSSLIDLGIQQAVDIYGIKPDGTSVIPFSQPVTACLRGDGQLVILRAMDQPRYPRAVDTFPNGDYTCTAMMTSGTLVLVDNPNP